MDHREFLTTLLQDAGAIMKQRFSQSFVYSEKGRSDLVSDVDIGQQPILGIYEARNNKRL